MNIDNEEETFKKGRVFAIIGVIFLYIVYFVGGGNLNMVFLPLTFFVFGVYLMIRAILNIKER